MFGLASQVMGRLLLEGGCVAIEWPADSGWWGLPEVQQFEKYHGLDADEYISMVVCCVFMVKRNPSIKKPWCVSSCDERILKVLAEYQRDGSHEHEPAEGSQTKQTGFYTEKFVSVILGSWYPQKWCTSVPDLSSVSALVTRQSRL